MNPVALLNIAGLAPQHLERPDLAPNLAALAQRGLVRPLRPSFPAVTCSVQASLLSGQPPAQHGIVGNGWFDRDTHEVKFWDQPGALVQAPRIWDSLKTNRPGLKTAVLFWQQSLYINADIVISPRPLHLDSGLVPWCYSKPAGFYEHLRSEIGEFKLPSYWGPVASVAGSRWIAQAAAYTWRFHRPDLLLVYLPHLDYAAQKYGPGSVQDQRALTELDAVVGDLIRALGDPRGTIVVVSEYSLSTVRRPVYPNRILRAAGLLQVREIAGKEYLDTELSAAFAVVDHQVAHLYAGPEALPVARAVLTQAAPGIEFASIDHPRAGDLVAVAPSEHWFAYYWWTEWSKAPEYAFTVDIHRKPGYDPGELWFDWKRMARTFKPATGTDPDLVRGSHGRVPRPNQPDGWATLLLDETAARELNPAGTVNATDVAPLVMRLLEG
ncbi:alkaline phosphatase family protein [bacterium]|nr:alkaline phosphatase family protein [bacterium]